MAATSASRTNANSNSTDSLARIGSTGSCSREASPEGRVLMKGKRSLLAECPAAPPDLLRAVANDVEASAPRSCGLPPNAPRNLSSASIESRVPSGVGGAPVDGRARHPRPLSASVWAHTPSSSASASTKRWRPRSASRGPAARSVASGCRRSKRSLRRSLPSSRTSRSAAVRRRFAPTSTSSCRTSLTEDPAGSRVRPHTDLDGVPAGYRAMADRESLKVMIEP